TTQLVDQGLEAGEIDLYVVVERQIESVSHRLHHQRRSSERVSGVDLVLTVSLDRHQGVTRDAEDQGLALRPVEPRHHHDVTSCSGEVTELLGVDSLPTVAPDQQEI